MMIVISLRAILQESACSSAMTVSANAPSPASIEPVAVSINVKAFFASSEPSQMLQPPLCAFGRPLGELSPSRTRVLPGDPLYRLGDSFFEGRIISESAEYTGEEEIAFRHLPAQSRRR